MAIDAEKLFELCEKEHVAGFQLMLKIAQIYFERYKIAKRSLHDMVRTPTVIMSSGLSSRYYQNQCLC